MISELQRYRLDKEILRIDIESSDLFGTIADRRRAISKTRNETFLKVNTYNNAYYTLYFNLSLICNTEFEQIVQSLFRK